MIQPIKPSSWKLLLIAAAIGILCYVPLQMLPYLSQGEESAESSNSIISHEEAQTIAIQFAEKILPDVEVKQSDSAYQSNSLFYGYLARYKLQDAYATKAGDAYPTDTYQVDIRLQNGGSGSIFVHMTSGKIVAWKIGTYSRSNQILDEGHVEQAATTYLASIGISPDQYTVTDNTNGNYNVTLNDNLIGETKLTLLLTVRGINDQTVVTQFKPKFEVPEEHSNFVNAQKNWATEVTFYVYLAPTILFFALSLVFGILYKQYTSFKRGLILFAIIAIGMTVATLNSLKGTLASQEQILLDPMSSLIFKVIMIITAVLMASSAYVAFVGGDALWRKQGRNVWPRSSEAGFGKHIWDSAKASYLLAFALLGLQAIIFLVLENVIDSWSTTDVTQSPLNMSLLWLMPAMGWAAALSEEAVYRLFGFGLFRNWLLALSNTKLLRNVGAGRVRLLFWNGLAALPSSIIWACGHVLYPIYPTTTRLIELIIIGVVFSFIIARFGFYTAAFTHGIFNSILMSLSLIMSGETINIVSAIFFILVPLPIAYLARSWHNKRLAYSNGGNSIA